MTISNSAIVTPDNFIRAETDRYFGSIVRQRGFGAFRHYREPISIEQQNTIRTNRDTLYSAAVFDLDVGPVTITLPDPGERFMSMQVIDEDEYTSAVIHRPGAYELTKQKIGTRYVMVAIRTLVDPDSRVDVEKVRALQDRIRATQESGPGQFEVPHWDESSHKRVRDALLALSATLPNTARSFGTREEVDPVRHLVGAASAWGGNPDKEAVALSVYPTRNDGRTIYRLTVRDVPVDGFWSISVYNREGYFEKNSHNAYSLNSITARKSHDGSVTVQFGGCNGKTPNCLEIMPGWNYLVRLYRPRPELTGGRWVFPEAHPVG
jgi:hypothetical protein